MSMKGYHVKKRIKWDVLRRSIESCNASGMTDKEIALTIGCVGSTLCVKRAQWGIGPADKFVKGFKKMHGDDAVERFILLIQEERASLTFIGRYFGFTRQYAHQVKNHLIKRGLLK